MDKELLIRQRSNTLKQIVTVELKIMVDVYKNVHWVYFFCPEINKWSLVS